MKASRIFSPLILLILTTKIQNEVIMNKNESINCVPGSGWIWVKGPDQPEVATQAQTALAQIGIDSVVHAEGYGERDSCGNFYLHEIDFSVMISVNNRDKSEQSLVKIIHHLLRELAGPRLGNIEITLIPEGTRFKIPNYMDPEVSQDFVIQEEHATMRGESLQNRVFLPLISRSYSPEGILKRNVYVIIYDPLLSNGQYLSDYLGWNDHTDLTNGTIEFFRHVTNNNLWYHIVYTTVITDGWPVKIDGFRYTEEEYLAVIRGERPPHDPDTVDYNAIVNAPELDICGKVNRGEIDEVWIYNGPYFGFYESTLVGPGAYWYNSPPVPGPYACQRLIPIMGPSPERGLDSAIHNFGHRMEATMTKVYGSWDQNRTTHNWERFALVKALSPNYSYSGCGNIHYPPNGVTDYDYQNHSYTPSNCDDFFNYPNLSDPNQVKKQVNCSFWNCNELNYLEYWFRHIPSANGCGLDGKSNNWWKYFADPSLALNPVEACP